MTDADAWNVLLEIERPLRAKLARLVGSHRVDDVWTEVILDKATRLAVTYNPLKGNVNSYFLNSLLLYAFKWKCISARRPMHRDLFEHDAQQELNKDHPLEVQLILDQLSSFDRWLLQMKDMEGFTFRDIGEHLDVSPITVGRWYADALRNAKDAAGVGCCEAGETNAGGAAALVDNSCVNRSA